MKTKLANFWNSNSKYYLMLTMPVVSIFFLIPFELYYNGRQYWNWNYHLPVNLTLAGIILYIILAGIMLIISRRNSKFISNFALIAFCIGFYVLLADVLSPLQISKLDGSALFSKEPLHYSIIEAGIFLAIVIFFIKGDSQYKVAISTAISLILIIFSISYLFLVLCTPKPQ